MSVTAMNPLFRMALLKGTPNSVLLHVRRGAPLDVRDHNGMSALMLTACAGRKEIVTLLIEEGADIAATLGDRTAYDMACDAGQDHVVALLKQHLPPSPVSLTSQIFDDSTWFNDPENGSGWEPEIVFSVGETDREMLSLASGNQATISASKAPNRDTDWQDIHVDLPASLPRFFERTMVRTLRWIAEASCNSLIGTPHLMRLSRKLPGLHTLLDDLGISTTVTDFEFALLANSKPFDVVETAENLDEIADALAAIQGWQPSVDLYLSDIEKLPAIDRSSEESMFCALRKAKRQVMASLVKALPIAGALLEEPVEPREANTEFSVEDERLDGVDEDLEMKDDETFGDALRAIRDGRREIDIDEIINFDLDLNLVERVAKFLSERDPPVSTASSLCVLMGKYLEVRNRIIEANLPLVFRYAERYRQPGVLFEDLIQDGSIGLMRAVERFDVGRGNRFMTYAIWWIRQACGRTMEDHARTVRLPVYIVDQVNRVASARASFQNREGAFPSIEELALELSVPVSHAKMLDRLRNRGVSIEEPAVAACLAAMVAPNGLSPLDAALARNANWIVSRVLETLPARQERILRSRFGIAGAEEKTLEEIGSMMSVTRERIRQIESKALSALGKRKTYRNRQLRALL